MGACCGAGALVVDYGFRSSSILDLDLLGLSKNGTTPLPCPNLVFFLVLLLKVDAEAQNLDVDTKDNLDLWVYEDGI